MFRGIIKYFLPVIPLVFFSMRTISQSFTEHLYTTADGLSDNYIFSVFQDSYGYLWVCTPQGLNRFDGQRFVNYGFKQGLPSLYVDNVFEDHSHRLWLGTRLGIAELKGDSCYAYPVNDKAEIRYVSGFLEGDSGRVWATTDKGVYEYRDNKWMKKTFYPGASNNSVGGIIKNSNGLYINYNNKMVVHQKLDGTYKVLLAANTTNPYFNRLFSKNDTVYLSTYDGLKRLEQNTWVPLFEDSLAKKYIYTSYKDNANRFWFGTKQDGVLSISSAGNIKAEYVHIPLSFNLVSGFFEDRDKNIWVAGFRGLLKLTPANFKILSLPAFQKIGTIRKSICLPSGKTLLSGDDGHIIELQPQRQGGALPIPSHSFHLDAANDFIDFSSFDDVGRVWFTTRESNLYRLDDRKLKKFNSIVFPGNNHFRGLCYNKKQKKLYVCGDSVLLSGDENHLDTFFSEPAHQFIPLPLNIYVEEDNGSMLVQTLENGLFLITGKNEIQPVDKKINFSLAVLNTVGNNDRENIIWAVYQGKSIMKYRWKTNQVPEVIDSITEKNGLPYNYILDLVIDDEKKIWLATSKGIVLMQKEANGKWITQHVLINESGSFSPLSFSRLMNDRLGNIWLTLQDKVLIFNSAKTKLSPIETHTVIENVLLFNQPTNWTPATDSVEGYRMVPVHPVLNYNQNTLSIFFNGLQYSDNFQTEYTYRLAPLDTSWSSPGQSNSVSFYQLAPANYSFQVRSRLKGFEWGEAAVFAFKIKIPIWDRWWFRLAIILIASGIIFFMFRQRLKQLNIRTGLKNQLRELEMKALKAQMNPHFIHNALNSIQSLIINHRSEEAGYYVSKFARLLRQVFENSEKNLISLEKELDTLQLYVDLEMLRLNLEVIYHIHIDEDLIVSEIKIPPLILQPFVENALWHGLNNKTGQKMLTASITEKDGYIVCEITDNGVGRKKAGEVSNNFPEGNLSMAVHTTRQRLLEFNQSPNVEPVSFIDLVEGNVPAGTKVVIRIKSTYGQA